MGAMGGGGSIFDNFSRRAGAKESGTHPRAARTFDSTLKIEFEEAIFGSQRDVTMPVMERMRGVQGNRRRARQQEGNMPPLRPAAA